MKSLRNMHINTLTLGLILVGASIGLTPLYFKAPLPLVNVVEMMCALFTGMIGARLLFMRDVRIPFNGMVIGLLLIVVAMILPIPMHAFSTSLHGALVLGLVMAGLCAIAGTKFVLSARAITRSNA